MVSNLVTGGLGFLGSYLVRRLVDMGEAVVALDVSNNTTLVQDVLERIKVIRSDFSDWTAVAEIVRENKVNSIFHVGAIVPPVAEQTILTTFRINVQGTINVLETARLFDVSSVIYASTIGVYGADAPAVVGDDFIQRPSHIYGMSKSCSERLGEQYYRRYNVNFRGLRFSAIIGPGRRRKGPAGFCDRAIGEPLCGRGYSIDVEPTTCLSTAVYVKDAVDGLIALREADEGSLTRRMYNNHGLSIVAGELCDEVKKQIPHAQLDIVPDLDMSAALKTWPRLDDSSARQDWNWYPRFSDIESYVADCITEGKSRPYTYR
jgi:nucleoside-diphosphate-sugar epimerase